MRPVIWVMGPIAVLACASPAAGPARATVRDSAGISIVENAAPLAADSVALLVDSVPAVEIGGTEDPHAEFVRIAGVLRLTDGGIAVADGNAQELKIFDSTGAWRRLAGGKGGGPGEFEQLGGVYRFGVDTLAVYDWSHRRISVFTAGGDLVREITLSTEGGDGGFRNVLGTFGDGEFLVLQQQFGRGSEKSGLQRDTLAFFRYTRDGILADSIGRFPGPELYRDVESSGGRIRSVMSTLLPFGVTLIVKPAGDRVHVGSGERYEIAQYDRSGKLTRLVRRAYAPSAVTAPDIAEFKRLHLEGFRPGMEPFRDRTKLLLDRMTFPVTKPAYDDFLAGDDGVLWVRRYFQPAVNLPTRYDLFDRDGQWLGHATFPPRFTLHHAGPGYALGVWKDPDDAERVRLHHLRPAQ